MAGASATDDPLSDFKKLSSTISLYTPPTSGHATQPSKNEPTLVVLCTWAGGATPTRLSKYTSTYQSLLPSTPIVLIQAHPLKTAFMPFPIPLGHFVSPAISAVKDHVNGLHSVGKQPRVLLHIFSHAGSTSALALLSGVRDQGIDVLLQAVIFDSCPGDMGFYQSWSALSVSLPSNPILKAAANSVIVPALASSATMQEFGILRPPDSVSKALGKLETFGSTRRLYLLGKKDRVIDWKEGWRHGLDAQRLIGSGRVEVCLFPDGEHCALILNGEQERYWGAVRSMWEGELTRESKL